jgi:hypothetical protein
VNIGRNIRSLLGRRCRLIGVVAGTAAAALLCMAPAAHAAPNSYSVCDADGPCLNLIESTPGSAITMYHYSSTDSYEALYPAFGSGDYGCTQVTATCPFTNTSLDHDVLGDKLYVLEWTYWGGCADAYPSVDMEWGSCSLDRSVFLLDGELFISPYWTNHYGTFYVLTGPPLGEQAGVTQDEASTRQLWTFKNNSA